MKKPLLDVVRILGITLAVYLVMRYLLPLVIPFLIAFFIAKQLYPLVEKFRKRLKLKRGIAIAVILLLFLAVLLWLLWLLGRNLVLQLRQLSEDMPTYQDQVIILWGGFCSRVEVLVGMKAGTLDGKVMETIPKLWDNVKGTLLPSLIGSSVSWIKGLIVLGAVLIVVGISTLLFVKEYDALKLGLEKSVLGRSVLAVFRRVYQAGGGYLKAQVLIMLVVSGVCIIGLFCTGNPYALLAGIGIGLCDALPFLGTGTIFIPWAVIEIINGRYVMAAVYAVIYTIANLTRELLEPKLVGDKLGMPPLAVIVSVYIGLGIFGLWGFALGPLSYILIREIRRELLA